MPTTQTFVRPLPWGLTAAALALLSACAAAPEPPAPAVSQATPTKVVTPAAPAPQPQPAVDPRAQFRQLSESLASASAVVEETADGRVRISVPSDLSFDLGKADVQAAMGPLLDQVAESLNRHPATRAEIVGHTDASGRAASNQALSLRRAESTRDELVKRQVAAERLSVKGVGQDEPVADNKTREGRSANRRVEIFISRP